MDDLHPGLLRALGILRLEVNRAMDSVQVGDPPARSLLQHMLEVARMVGDPDEQARVNARAKVVLPPIAAPSNEVLAAMLGPAWCAPDGCPASICNGPHEQREVEGLGTVTIKVGEPWPSFAEPPPGLAEAQSGVDAAAHAFADAVFDKGAEREVGLHEVVHGVLDQAVRRRPNPVRRDLAARRTVIEVPPDAGLEP